MLNGRLQLHRISLLNVHWGSTMKSAVKDKVHGDGFLLEIADSVTFNKSKAYAAALKRLQGMGFTEGEAKEILGESNV